MFKQLFLSTAIATAFAVTPVLADDHEKMNKDDPEWEQKVNKTQHDMDKKHQDNEKKMDKNRQGDTTTYDEMDEDMDVVPDEEAYDKDKGGNDKHPAHKMGEEGYPE
ncbi:MULTISPECIES: hypothetical protein [unclassified Methylophaga]|jgi:Ni/Co efflux regulator RcnB|nr:MULTISPECIES: hypothetical protein [unclassified Methylophaga]MAL50801.1 hypothetical protein [Methylophaga sp.]MBP23779.1 hypothetical protein [Methylophaga sp.]HAD30120.1 hypothetical protein [Methylophaga sp.]HCC80685.1 hypothetical protein [Methylophaga sp.]|tara:strand:+ start:6479 stop:6799 length:321 start_codon:yes stop_codon:yes gene_type:complete